MNPDNISQIPGYVYKITHIPTKQYYWGSRTKNITLNILPSDDLWKIYFTSSKTILTMIQHFGKESFIAEIIQTDYNNDIIFWTEQQYIKNNINYHLCLNKHYVDISTSKNIFSCYGRSKNKHPLYNLPKELNPNFGSKRTNEQRKHISDNHYDCSGANNSRASKWELVSPDGNKIECCGNLELMTNKLGIGIQLLKKHLGSSVPQLSIKACHPMSKKTIGWRLNKL